MKRRRIGKFGCSFLSLVANIQSKRSCGLIHCEAFVVSSRTLWSWRSCTVRSLALNGNDIMGDSNMDSLAKMGTLCLRTYLEDTQSLLDPCYEMTLDESHRKIMMRTLMGCSKVEFDQRLREHERQLQWENAKKFFWKEFMPRILSPPPLAPDFSEGIERYEEFSTTSSPRKFLSFLARGRTYKGQFLSLLQDLQPDLVPVYQEQIVTEIPELDLLKSFVQHLQNRKNEEDLVRLLYQCIEMTFPKAPPFPADGGISSGKRAEMDLQTFLELRQNSTKDSLVVSNVLVKAGNKKDNKKDAKSNILVISPLMDLAGMTSEFDAVILEREENKAKLVELWEAKASLHPGTIHDVLSKKLLSMGRVLSSQKDGHYFMIQGRRLDLVGDDATFPSTIGIYGSTILSPKSAARRTQILCCNHALETNATAVRAALETGTVKESVEMASKWLEKSIELSDRFNPMVIVTSGTNHTFQLQTV